ncbi:MAG: hypothetical protein EPO64_03965 [Nitrospirae bacterium]|nr:MAG: hypothetical protein EPO64_03965 [Nitrospirota bacterium]
MFMRSTRNRLLDLLSTTVVVTLFLCQVIGSLCPVMPPAVGMAATIHMAHVGHTMEAGSMCADSLPASSTSVGSPATPTTLVIESFGPDLPHAGLSAHAPADTAPARSGPPLFTRLSTFRI